MALNPTRSVISTTCWALRQCRPSAQLIARPLATSALGRQLSTTTTRPSETPEPEAPVAAPEEQIERPRWSYTPPQMIGPGFSLNEAYDPINSVWKCNEDPRLLDAMYNRLLGPNGEKMLPDELKWLAITHKSFDQGRRGFNTRLAYLGRHILTFETTRSILISNQKGGRVDDDGFNREPFQHPALANVDKLTARQPQVLIHKNKLGKLATDVGLPEVIRWKPRKTQILQLSGHEVVLNTALYAIIGAISLHSGGDVAGRVARERILRRLGAYNN